MSSLSKIVVSGRVVKAPEKRFTPSTNVAVTEFVILVESPARGNESPETSPVKVVTWRDLAERCAQEIKKGDMVAVDGRLQINNFTASDGQKKREVEVDAIAVENLSHLLEGGGGGGGAAKEPAHARTGGKSSAKSQPAQEEDLDAIFSEDEIPF